MTRLVLSLPFALCLLLASCDVPGPEQPRTIEETTFAPALGVDLTQSVKTASGEYLRDLAVGTGAPVANGQTITAHYTGYLPDGTVFDSNDGAAGGLSFVLGAGKVIEGWDKGLPGANVGGTRQLIIPPEMGYGPSAYGPIPANSILVFTVHIDSAQ